MVPVHVGDNLPETIMGSFWFGIMRLVADNPPVSSIGTGMYVKPKMLVFTEFEALC
jgi:hypothetical protein